MDDEYEDRFVQNLCNGDYKNIIILTGAGVSTYSGIPDFRGKDGIYKKYTEKDFSSSSSKNVEAIQEFANACLKKEPNIIHQFCAFIDKMGWLKRLFTQNIDSLHQLASYEGHRIPPEKIVKVHGDFNNLVLFGDEIPVQVKKQIIEDFVCTNDCDLMLVMGTSLKVYPINCIPNMVNKDCTRVLVTNDMSHLQIVKSKMESLDCSLPMTKIKFGKRLVSSKQQWFGDSKWKKQYKYEMDLVDFVKMFNISIWTIQE